MRIISEARLREYGGKDKNALKPLNLWRDLVRKADWKDFSDVRNYFNHADIYGNCVIFNIGGNKYRMIAKVEYQKHLVFIRAIMTHSEYEENKWCSDCE